RRVLARVIASGLLAVEGRNRSFRPFNRATQWMIWKVGCVEKLAQEFVWRVFDHLHLFDDDALLALKVFINEARVSQHVRYQIERGFERRVHDLHSEPGHLLRSECVEMAAQA